jgi:PIN domain nuclease of toxin-antitoxin system
MNYLIDTQILVWTQFADKRLTASVFGILENMDHAIYYSVVSPWELAIKQAAGKLILPKEFYTMLPKQGFDCIPIEEKHIEALRELPLLHRDPFDRMLAAQAAAEHMTLITSDKRLAAYPIKTLLVNS